MDFSTSGASGGNASGVGATAPSMPGGPVPIPAIPPANLPALPSAAPGQPIDPSAIFQMVMGRAPIPTTSAPAAAPAPSLQSVMQNG